MADKNGNDLLAAYLLLRAVPVIRAGAVFAFCVIVGLGQALLVRPSREPGSWWYEWSRAKREGGKLMVWAGVIGAPAFLAGGLASLAAPGFGWPVVVAVASLQFFVVRSGARRWPVIALDGGFWDEQARIGPHDRRGSVGVLVVALAFAVVAALLVGLNEWARPS